MKIRYYKCPKCGSKIIKGKYGFYCSSKCGMNVQSIYGKILGESIVTNLLYMHEHPHCKRKSITSNINGTRYTLFPWVHQDIKNGRSYYNWYHFPIPKT